MPCPCCQAATPPDGHFCTQCGTRLAAQGQAADTTRRQMTVLFCDLADSTGLARRVDPDDLLAVLRQYHDTVRSVATRFGGTIARIVGDGVDVYFGYPQANEDDASRALHAALALATEVGYIEAAPGTPLAVRIGVATGIVAASVDQGVVAGTTPNLAARIQAAMPAGAIGVSPGTRRIAGAQFEFDDLGSHALKGFDTPVALAALRRARSLDSRSAWRGRDADLAMVGRDAELAALLRHWRRACTSQVTGRVCGAVIAGDPGLGKSRLVTALERALPGSGHAVVRLQCSPFHVNSTLQPFVQHLAAAAGIASADSPELQLDKLAARLALAGIGQGTDCAMLAALLGLPAGGRWPVPAAPPPMQLQWTRDALVRYFTGLAHASPLLLVIEDMHWVDPTSLALVDGLLAGGAGAPILLVLTARHGFAAPWQDSPDVITLALRRLRDGEARAVAAQQSRRADLPAEWLATIVERADGIPLFIEEMTRMLLDSRAAGVDGAAAGRVPDTLLDLLTERLDRLPPAGKLTAQLASVIGREFDRALLAAAAPDSGTAWRDGLQAMLDSGLVLPRGADGEWLLFRHALVEDTAYVSLPPKRRAALHARVAAALSTRFRERVERQPELLARHLGLAGDGQAAAGWWQAAGAQALSQGAPREAAGHLRAGIAALHVAPPGPRRDAAELGLLSMLGPTTMVLLGPGSAEFGAYQERAYALSSALPDQPRLFSITYGWCLFNWARARLAGAAGLAGGLLDRAARQPADTELAMAAHNMAGMVRFHLGDTQAARAHLAHSTAVYEPGRDAALYPVYLMDFGVFGRFYLALCTQLLGDPDDARRIAGEALRLADGLNQPHTAGFAMLAGVNLAVLRGDTGEALALAERCIGFASQFGFPEFIAMARVARGWALAHGLQRWAEGLAEVQAGIDGWAHTGFENWQPWYATLQAEMLICAGQAGLALEHVERHLARIAANGERQFESPLLAERAAALAVLDGRPDAAAIAFDSAAALAREQAAVAWIERIERRRREALAGTVAAA